MVMDWQLRRQGASPVTEDWVYDVDASESFGSCKCQESPCLVKSRGAGLWISSRGRRISIYFTQAPQIIKEDKITIHMIIYPRNSTKTVRNPAAQALFGE